MSIIQKSVEGRGEVRLKRRVRQVTKRPDHIEQFEEDTEQDSDLRSSIFNLDAKFLAEQGFYTPTEKPQRLSLELRAVKRRLLRRMNFYKPDGTRRYKKSNQEKQRNTVLMTSTRPAEGKTFTAINLALSFAIEDNISVLLVDADVPRPKVFSHFGLAGGKGLTDRIVNPSLDVPELLMRAEEVPLALMSEGTQYGSATEIFQRQEMADFVDELSQRYSDRIIIFDAPPVLATPEAVVLAKYVDEVVFVVEAMGTPEPAVATALDELLDSNQRISLVLNRSLVSDGSSQYGSYEEYYYRARRDKSGVSHKKYAE